MRSELPPVISILLDEPPPTGKIPEIKRWYRRLSPELRRQARWTDDAFEYPELTPLLGGLRAVPSGGLDPCRSVAVCRNAACRLKAARQFARTVGLYADHIVLADELTFQLVTGRRFSDHEVYNFATNATVLHELRPLIDAGVVSFRSLLQGFCDDCFGRFTETVRAATIAVLDELRINPNVQIVDGGALVDAEELYGYPMVHYAPLDASSTRSLSSRKARERLVRSTLQRAAETLVRDAAINLNEAATVHGTLMSGSRVSMLAIRQLEQRNAGDELDVWEAARSLQLPWVRDLSVEEIVHLRELAADALPRLRERLGGALRGGENAGRQLSDCIHELREEAIDVEEELKALRPRHESIFRNVTGLLGVGIAIYGFGAGFVPPAAALGSLMTLLGLLHTSEQKEYGEAQRSRSKPGYVLVKARDLLDHAENGGG